MQLVIPWHHTAKLPRHLKYNPFSHAAIAAPVETGLNRLRVSLKVWNSAGYITARKEASAKWTK